MVKILIVETSTISKTTSIAHVRNAISLHQHLIDHFECELVDLTMDVDVSKQWDIILFSYASARADYSKIEVLINNQDNVKIGWITNEFELFANEYVKQKMTFMINNFDREGIKQAHRHDRLLTTNLNTLIMRTPNPKIEKKYDMCYYGTYRKYREGYFRKYFKENMILSASKKNWKNFIDVGIDGSCNVTEKFSWEDGKETLNLFKASLYIEDTKTHTWFNHMANRFFEGLYCNTPLFFDVTCKNTIRKDVYEIDDYFIVDGYDELEDRIKNIDQDKVDHFLTVNSSIALEERTKTLDEILEFLKDIHNNSSESGDLDEFF